MSIPNLPIKMISRNSGSAGLIVVGLIATLLILANRKKSQVK
jgi:hypothetical protein